MQIGEASLAQGTAAVTIPEQGFDPGTFYIQVKTNALTNGNWSSAEQYTLVADFTPTDGSYESEPNDSLSQADKMQPNTPITGRLSAYSDTDYYRVTLDSAAQFSLTLEHALPENLKSDTPWRIQCFRYDEASGSLAAEPMLSMDAALGDTMTESETALTRGGTFYIAVTSTTTASDMAYTLTMHAETLTYEKGDVNSDGAVNAMDVSALLVSSARQAVGYTEGVLTGENALAADVNEDGEINAMDASYILTYSAKMGAGLDVDWDSLIGK